ncbi:MAG: sigma-70 family RNA polymerase sigma factor [Lachnospiraceae bacterium]|nr:sigma-70 family RNA polymerase sigma factor [Lachnospiraceae bacterium]
MKGQESREGAENIHKEEQLTALIDSYQNLVFSICYKMTSDYFAAEDLAQDTFLSAYEHLKSFDGSNPKAWICRIATNKCIDYLSHSGRRSIPTEDVALESNLGAETNADHTNTPEHIYMEREMKEQLLFNCSRLKPPYDEVAKAYYYDEMEVKEIAARRGQKIKTVQTQIYRARAMLRKIYRKENSA